MKMSFLRSLMLAAVFAAVFAVLIPVPSFALSLADKHVSTLSTPANEIPTWVPAYTRPPGAVEIAAFKLKQSDEGAFHLPENTLPAETAEAVSTIVSVHQHYAAKTVPADGYLLITDGTGYMLAAMRSDETVQFILANNEEPLAVMRPLVALHTETGTHILLAVYREMNTRAPSPTSVLAHTDNDQPPGGRVYQVNTQFDNLAATADQDDSGAWIVTR